MGNVLGEWDSEAKGDSTYCGDDILSTINDELMEKILANLELKDLVSLCKTSKKMKEHVQNFSLHYVLSYSRMDRLLEFINCEILNPSELMLKKRITQHEPVNLKTSVQYLKWVKLYGHMIRRYSITEAEEFPHYGNPSYIRRQPYPLLGRDIVRLKTVCWLYFKKNLPQVPAGKYQVSLHLQLRADLSWPSVGGSSTAQLTVFKENVDKSEPPLADVVMESEYWRKIKCDKFDNGLLRGKANIIRSTHSVGKEEWFFIKFKPFTILQDTNLAFEWKDIDNPYWKRGMCWDYIQIEKV